MMGKFELPIVADLCSGVFCWISRDFHEICVSPCLPTKSHSESFEFHIHYPMYSSRVKDKWSPAIWATIWRRSHGRQMCRPNGLIKLINYLIYLKRLAYLLYGSVASLPSPSSNFEVWPYSLWLLQLGH